MDNFRRGEKCDDDNIFYRVDWEIPQREHSLSIFILGYPIAVHGLFCALWLTHSSRAKLDCFKLQIARAKSSKTRFIPIETAKGGKQRGVLERNV